MEERLKNIRVVLVKPQDSRNVGSVCRAMKTMGLSSLWIVGAENFDPVQAGVTAVHAKDILERAVFAAGLSEALKDTVLSAGITRRAGKRRKYFALTPETLATRVAGAGSGTVALVFGSETTGLNSEQLDLCRVAVRIPSSPLFPSLNLSHAVQIIAYQLYRALAPISYGGFSPICAERLEALVQEILSALKELGFFTLVGPEELGIFWSDILARAGLSSREAERLEALFKKVKGLALKKRISS